MLGYFAEPIHRMQITKYEFYFSGVNNIVKTCIQEHITAKPETSMVLFSAERWRSMGVRSSDICSNHSDLTD